MPDWKQFVRERLPRLGLSGEREADVVEELAQLLEDRYASAREEGLDDAAARRRAIAKFPSGEELARQILAAERPLVASVPAPFHAEHIEMRLRNTRRGQMLHDFLQDVRGALRLLQKNPGFTAVAVVTLTLGIAANTAIFTVVNTVVFQPLPYPDAHELVRLYSTNLERGFNRINLSYPDMQDFAANSKLLAGIAGITSTSVNFSSDGRPERLDGARATPGFFEMLKLRPLQGRTLLPADSADQQPVVVLTERLWRRRFAAENIVGRRVILNGQGFTVVGVVPDIQGLAEVWLPLDLSGSTLRRNNRFLTVFGRVQTGRSVQALRAELEGIARNLATAYPDTNKGSGVRTEPLKSVLVDAEDRAIAAVLMGFVTLVLGIACANIANLLLARSVVRQREIAVRATLGATRSRLIRQLLTESVVLAGAGGVLGIAAGYGGLQWLVSVLPPTVPRLYEIHMDGWSVLYTVVLTVFTGLLFGLAPILQLSRSHLLESLRSSGHGQAGGARASGRLRSSLVAAQVGLALALLICAGLFGKTLVRLTQIQLGFETEKILTFRFTLPRTQYDSDQRLTQLNQQFSERLRAVPGITDVAFTSRLPIAGSTLWRGYMRAGDTPPEPGKTQVAIYTSVSSTFFRVVGMPFVGGRSFLPREEAPEPKVAVINQLLADQLWPGGSAVGKRIRIHTDEDYPREIVGVVANARHNLQEPPEPQVFVPYSQSGASTVTYAVRTAGEPYLFREPAQNALHEVDPNVPIFAVLSMNDVVGERQQAFRSLVYLLGGLAAAALGLAVMGIYGVVSYSVQQRTREIGVRMALGARPGEVVRLVLRQGFKPVGVGLLIGLAIGLGANQVLAKQLATFATLDPLLSIVTAAALGGIGALSCLLPARRAARIDPLVALRYE